MDRATALDWAARARRTRHDVVESVRSGSADLATTMAAAATDDLVGRIHVVSVVEAVPGWGKVVARRALADLGIAETTPLRDVDADALVERFGVAP
jgi:hypothetical protein